MKNNINEAMKITVRTNKTTVEILFKDAQEVEQVLIESGFTKTEDYTYVRPNNFKYQQVMKILQPINRKAQEENQKAQSEEIEKIRNEIKQLLK